MGDNAGAIAVVLHPPYFGYYANYDNSKYSFGFLTLTFNYTHSLTNWSNARHLTKCATFGKLRARLAKCAAHLVNPTNSDQMGTKFVKCALIWPIALRIWPNIFRIRPQLCKTFVHKAQFE